MVPCLYQSNVYIKRKLQVWRVQKCIPLLGAKTTLTCAGLQTTPSHVSQYRAANGNLRKSRPSFRHASVFGPKQCLYQNEATDIWRVQKCIFLVGAKTALICARLQTTPSHVSQYRAENGNLRNSGSTFRNGTVFPPKELFYYNEARGMESPKMYCSSRCKNRASLCGTANYTVSCKPVQGRERKFAEIRVPFAMVLYFHQSNVYIKTKLQVWRVQKCIFLVGAKTALTFAGLQTTPSHLSQYRAENRNLRKSVSTFRHGTVFPSKKCLHQNEATGMESPKMHFSTRCKNHTYMCRTANYLI